MFQYALSDLASSHLLDLKEKVMISSIGIFLADCSFREDLITVEISLTE